MNGTDCITYHAQRGDKLKIPVSPDTVLAADDVLITLSEHKTVL